MLTLIKVPGKRKRKHRTDTEDGETMSSNQGVARTSRHRKASNKRLQVSTSVLKLSSLERLPTELLERIFLFSLNFGLPRSSPIIGSKLSNHHIYMTTATTIFDPTWRYTCRRSNEQERAILDTDNGQVVPGDPELQTSLLRCRWTTVNMIRQAEIAWLLKARPMPVENEIEDVAKTRNDLYTSDSERSVHMTTDASAKRLWHNAEHEAFDADFADFLHTTKPGAEKVENISLRPVFRWKTTLSIHPQTEIPESLLRGPWSPDMVMYLFWLTRAGARIDYSGSTNGEVARQGLDRAIRDGNLQILYLLHCLGIETTIHENILKSAVQTCSGNKDTMCRIFHILASKYPGENSSWDRWFEDILESAEKQGKNREEKQQQRMWWEGLVSYMLPLLKP